MELLAPLFQMNQSVQVVHLPKAQLAREGTMLTTKVEGNSPQQQQFPSTFLVSIVPTQPNCALITIEEIRSHFKLSIFNLKKNLIKGRILVVKKNQLFFETTFFLGFLRVFHFFCLSLFYIFEYFHSLLSFILYLHRDFVTKIRAKNS